MSVIVYQKLSMIELASVIDELVLAVETDSPQTRKHFDKYFSQIDAFYETSTSIEQSRFVDSASYKSFMDVVKVVGEQSVNAPAITSSDATERKQLKALSAQLKVNARILDKYIPERSELVPMAIEAVNLGVSLNKQALRSKVSSGDKNYCPREHAEKYCSLYNMLGNALGAPNIDFEEKWQSIIDGNDMGLSSSAILSMTEKLGDVFHHVKTDRGINPQVNHIEANLLIAHLEDVTSEHPLNAHTRTEPLLGNLSQPTSGKEGIQKQLGSLKAVADLVTESRIYWTTEVSGNYTPKYYRDLLSSLSSDVVGTAVVALANGNIILSKQELSEDDLVAFNDEVQDVVRAVDDFNDYVGTAATELLLNTKMGMRKERKREHSHQVR
ncbi:hypothetical protein AB4254_07995 [Vibrio breoganii]